MNCQRMCQMNNESENRHNKAGQVGQSSAPFRLWPDATSLTVLRPAAYRRRYAKISPKSVRKLICSGCADIVVRIVMRIKFKEISNDN